MKKKTKTIVMFLLIIALIFSSYATLLLAKNNLSNNISGQTAQGEETQAPQNNTTDKEAEEETSTTQKEDGLDEAESESTPPELPSQTQGENSQSQGQAPPSMNGGAQPQGGEGNMGMPQGGLTLIYYIAFIMEGLLISALVLYLIMSKLNKKTFKETFCNFDKKLIFILSLTILTSLISATDVFIANKFFLIANSSENMEMGSSSVEASASVEVDGTEETLTESYTGKEADEGVILVKNGGELALNSASVTKTAGDSSNTENSEFYGINSGILVTENSIATIKDSIIATNAKGSNAVFSTGENSKIYISDSTITTTGESSARGLDATYSGYIEADNVKVTTKGDSCASLATDRGEGTVKANASTLETNGKGSPIIYSTGDISITNTTGTANGSQAVVIEGKNTASLDNSTIYASGAGNRGDVDICSVMIYQSMSGDASEGTGTFNASNSTLALQESSEYYLSAPMFFVTNTQAIINLENTKLVFGSDVLLSIKGTEEWGSSGSNGGNVTLNATNQILSGNIELDEISTLEINLTNSSTYKGSINLENTAKSVTLKLDSSSTITLTGDSYVTKLENEDSTNSNINFNGYSLYVNGTKIN